MKFSLCGSYLDQAKQDNYHSAAVIRAEIYLIYEPI